ncbi:Cna B-type domain-containing protein, partial [Peptoniphilus sp. oral taxon 386]|uniref:Cna B-type domain-containing protein n=1 Tax=Peptoniphilus sp. oral taxon 386 TaxID=652713 RepID=UPI0001DAA48F
EKTVEVINTSGGQGTVVEKTLEKVWVNGPKPTVTIELWRKNNVEGADKIDEKVDEFIVPANANGNDLKKTFTNLAKHDPKGNEFEYYAKEENVPANYTKAIDGLKVTNTYNQPSNGEVTVTKEWQDPDGKTLVKPEVNLTLYRKIEGGAEEQVPVAEAEVKVVNGTTTTAKWENLKTTDINGNAYSFIVKESFKNAGDVNNDNWTLITSTDVVNGAATIKNEALVSEADLGKLTVTKKPLVNGQGVRGPVGQRGTPLKFSFKVTGPAGYEESFELAATESKELKGLYFGEYKVEETDSKGYTATYSVTDGKVTLKAADKEKTVEVTNTSGGQGTVVEKTLEKVWVNGPKPTVTIELWRKNNVESADKIDEKVDEFIVPANASGNDLKKTFTNLAKHDPKGNEFEYYAKEENVPV